MMHDFTAGNRGGKVWGGIDKGVVEGEREGGGGTDKAVSADAVRGKVTGLSLIHISEPTRPY